MCVNCMFGIDESADGFILQHLINHMEKRCERKNRVTFF